MKRSKPVITHLLFNNVPQLPVLHYELASLPRDEFTAHLIAPSHGVPEDFSNQLPDVVVHRIRLRSRELSDRRHPLLKFIRYYEFKIKAFLTLLRIGPDIAVGHDMPAILPLFPWLLFGRRVRVVYNAHEIWSEAAEENAPLRGLWKKLERSVVSRADAVIVPEPNRARIMLEEYGAKQLPAVAANIPPASGVLQRTDALRNRLDLSNDDIIVLYQGLLTSSRCLQEVTEAFCSLPEHFHLALIGRGSKQYADGLRRLALTGELPGRIHFLDWIPFDELRDITASADVGVLLYRNKGRNNYYAAPNKLYEYLFAGLPLVSSDFPGLQAIIEGNGYGICADPSDSGAIAAAILAASKIESGALLADRARKQFRWEQQAEVIFDVYRGLFEGDRDNYK